MDPRPFRLPAPGKRPPDYTSRSVKLRLFLWTAAIILGLGAIDAARDPKTWQWLRGLRDRPTEPFHSDLPSAGWRTASDPAGTFVAVRNTLDDINHFDPAQRAWHSGWRQAWDRLSSDDRNLLFELLHAKTAQRPLSADRQSASDQLIKQIESLWNDYDAAAKQSLASLSPDDQHEWTALLESLQTRVTDETLPALRSAGKPATDENNHLDDLQSTLVALARHEIKDDTVVFRPAEQQIWFAEVARAQAAAAGKLQSAPHVAYLQLHKQPAEYRGQFVSVKGTVRLAYRVPATKNYLSIKEYVVYWLHPDGGPDSPILVYALDVPPGFPSIASDKPGETRRLPLREPVEVHGIFFKRAAYAAKSGLYTAPLIIASAPRWQPQPSVATARLPFTAVEFIAAAIAAFLLAVCVTAVLWKRTARRQSQKSDRGGFVELGPLDVRPSPRESIRELERQARAEGQVG